MEIEDALKSYLIDPTSSPLSTALFTELLTEHPPIRKKPMSVTSKMPRHGEPFSNSEEYRKVRNVRKRKRNARKKKRGWA